MKTCYGIVPTDSGQYTLVTVKTIKPGTPQVSVTTWNCDNRIKTALLLNRGVYCGLPCFWKSLNSRSSSQMHIAEDAGRSFMPGVLQADHDYHQSTLANNCIGIVPNDAFLCTVPLYFGDTSIHSFIAAYPHADHYEIGITINKELIAVFKIAPCKEQTLALHVRRIKLYFERTCPTIIFPEHVYLFGDVHPISCEGFVLHNIVLSIDGFTGKSIEELRALGAALAQTIGNVPAFSHGNAHSALRRERTWLYGASALLVLIALVLSGTLFIFNTVATTKLNRLNSAFSKAITNNPEIKNLLAQNKSLATAIIQCKTTSSAYTAWAPFLDFIGTQRPDGLYFELLGTEPIKGSAFIRLAVSGWARDEKLVADFIARLQKNTNISNISLSSLEKNDKKPTLCNYKIVCILKITSM